MKFYQRFLIGLLLTILAIILAFGFWYFNADMFSKVIFLGKTESQKPPNKSMTEGIEDSLLKLEAKAGQTVGIDQANILPANDDRELAAAGIGQIKTLAIPFTCQAPYAEWSNPIYQNACEEAAAVMVMHWVRGEELPKELADKEIADLSNWESENYGEFRDTSVEDTVSRIFKGYFAYEGAEVKKDASLEDIMVALSSGEAVIVPVNGRLLGNPYYTPPGPERHSLVIRGYDEETGEFITNDPGTRMGELYRYDKDVLYNAIRDYPTGYHLPIEKIEKNMIVVKRQ
jgi:hypothetical protein